MAKFDITSHERSALRAAAHPLRPVVLIGERGLSEAVLKEIDLNLSAHELIKVRVAGQDREAREDILSKVCDTLECAPVHHLGRTLVLYRPMSAATEDPLFTTRAQRKPSEPYTPKKLAAEGLTVRRHGRNREPAPARRAAKPGRAAPTDTMQNDAMRGHGIPRRLSGSAMTLRAGMRRARGAAKGRK